MITRRVSAVLHALVFLAQPALMAQGANDSVDAAKISALIQTIVSKDHDRMVHVIRYPFAKRYPVPAVASPAECLKRFDEIFDDTLIADISLSDPQRDWERVGWRGIMLGNGEVWLDEDYKIIAINHETAKSKAVLAHLIDEQKRRLPSALRNFDEPVLEWMTPHFLIRVDKKRGDLRLIVFKGHSYTQPIHILPHGDLQFDGSGGNYHMDWKSGGRTYRIDVDEMSGEYSSYEEYEGTAGPPGLEDRTPVVEERGRERTK